MCSRCRCFCELISNFYANINYPDIPNLLPSPQGFPTKSRFFSLFYSNSNHLLCIVLFFLRDSSRIMVKYEENTWIRRHSHRNKISHVDQKCTVPILTHILLATLPITNTAKQYWPIWMWSLGSRAASEHCDCAWAVLWFPSRPLVPVLSLK